MTSQTAMTSPGATADRLDLLGFGEAMVMVTPADHRPLEETTVAGLHVAGAELNVCAAAARLGARAGFATRVGADPLGRRVKAAAIRAGVDVDLVVEDERHPTGVFFKDVHPDGARRVHYYRAGSAASTMDVADARRVLDARPRLVVVSGITAALGPGPRRAVAHLLAGARRAGIRIALDPNLRPALMPVDDQVIVLHSLLSYVDVLLLGTDESGPLLGQTDPAEVFAAADRAGVTETVLKAGPHGCYVRQDGRPVHLETAATVVVDPVGAGDAFAGGYLVGRAQHLEPDAAAWLGSQLAAAVISTAGDTDGLPTSAEARALLATAARPGLLPLLDHGTGSTDWPAMP